MLPLAGFAQTPYPGCPNVSGAPEDPTLPYSNDTVYLACGQTCLALEAKALKTGSTSSYKVEAVNFAPPFSFSGGTPLFVGSDDIFSGIINLPFDFCFYNNTFNRLVVGANGCVSFNTAYAGGNCCYSHDDPIPTPNPPTCPLGVGSPGGLYRNTINGAFHDLDPTVGNPDINYSVLGSAPCRTFVVNFRNVPHFSCNNLRTTQQIVIYETTNVIEVYINDKPTCTSWNGGRATIGIQNGAGTVGIAPPGRNTGAWNATNEAWRFTPNGTPNYTVEWKDEGGNPFATGEKTNFCLADATELEKVFVEITYTNCNNATVIVEDSVVIAPRPPVTATATTTDALCNDSCDGTATISVNSGTAPFTFDWPFGTGSANENNLCAGSYTVDITDDQGCEGTVSFDIEEPTKIVSDLVEEPASCFRVADGTIDASATGGTPGYTYSWSSGETTPNITNSAGWYIVEIRDANNCLKLDSAEIEEPDLLVLDTISVSHLSCVDAMDGEISLTATGGTPAYEFSINGSSFEKTPNYSALSAGTYTATVRDENGCESTRTYTLTADSIRVQAPNDTIICQGQPITLTASGYFQNVTWNNGVLNNFEFTPSHLGDLEYIVVGQNAKGCEDKDTVVVRVEYLADPTIVPAGPFCANQPNDTLETNEAGGTWAGTGVNPEGIFSPGNAGQGNHQITYSFSGFCAVSDTIIISVNDEFDALIYSPGDICENQDPFDLTSATPGGTWTGPGIVNTNFPTFDPGLAGPGTHRVYHLIDNECGDYDSLDITVIQPTFADIDILPPLCAEAATKQLTVSPNIAGTWSGNAFIDASGNFDASSSGPGNFQVIFTPDGNCVTRDTSMQTVYPSIVAIPDSDSLKCKGDQNGTVTTQVSGGSGSGYTFNWNPGGNLGQTATTLSEGAYTVTVTDDNGCTGSTVHNIYAPDGMFFTKADSLVDPSCGGYSDGEIRIFVDGGTQFSGPNPYQLSINPMAGVAVSNGFTNLPTGSYVITATDASGCSISTNANVLTAPAPIDFTATINSANCFRSNGSIIFTSTSGGTRPFTFYWDNTLTPDSNLINQGPGTYLLSIIDDQGCQLDSNMVIPNSGSPIVTVSTTDAICKDSLNGTATATATNGISPYTFEWDGNPGSSSISGLGAGTHEVVVTDDVQCVGKMTFTIGEPSYVVVTPIADSLLCDGQVYDKNFGASGGNDAPYTFSVNNASIPGNNYQTSTAGTYNVVAYDDQGCPSLAESFNVSYRAPLQVYPTGPDSVCPGDVVTLEASATGGLGSYSFTWSIGASGSSISYPTDLSGNDDYVEVEVNDGCSSPSNAQIKISFYPPPAFNPVFTPLNGCEPLDIDVSVPNNQFQSVLWNLDNGNTVSTTSDFGYTYFEDGLYQPSATITTEHGCIIERSFSEIEVYPLPSGEILQQPAVLTSINNAANFKFSGGGGLQQVNWTLINTKNQDTTLFKTTLENILNHQFAEDSADFVLYAELVSVYGCISNTSKVVSIRPEHVMYVAKAFSPNGDGVNETFEISWLHIRPNRFNVAIYNRWGELVFESSNPDFSWDGFYKGSKAMPGIYTWKIDYYSEETRQKKIFGIVNVLD